MAISLTIAELLAALRLTDTPEELAEATRLHALASEVTTTTAPDAPDVVQNECVVRLAAFLYDQPNAAPGDSYANAWRASGAARLALPYVIHRAGLVGGDAVAAAQGAVGTTGNPVVGIDLTGDVLTVTFADGTTETHTLPAGGVGGVDQTARDAAAAAAGDVVTHNAAGDSHTDLRDAIASRITLDQVADTAQRLINSAGHATNVDLGVAQVAIQANANELTLHEATPHGGGMGGDTPTPTPPVTLVDGELYTAHGDLTIPGWRGYDFFQMFHTNAGTTYSTVAISVAQLIASSPFAVPFGRNVALMLAVSTTDNDIVTTSATTGNGVPVPTATSTMTVMAWFAGTVVDGGGGDGTDQTARDSAAQAQVAADTAQSEIDTHELSAHNTDATARASTATNADNLTAHALTPHGGGGTGDDAFDWATVGNTDAIPAEKLTNAPGGGTGDDAYGWATEGNTDAIPVDKLSNAPGGDDAYDWATVGNDALLVPTDKINFAGVQSQIDEIVDEIAHSEGEIIAVVPTIGSGMDSLRYTLPNNLNGLYDVSVRVSARVQVNEFANISGNLHIIEDGGLGLNAGIPEKTHNYHHAHDGVVNFFRKGLAIAPGVNQLDFTALVTGQNPPDVHFNEIENMTITNTSLVNSSNVNPFISDWAETDNTDDVPAGKLGNVKNWAKLNVSPISTPFAQELGGFVPADIAGIPNGGEQEFRYYSLVQKDMDATLAYLGGSWVKYVPPVDPAAGNLPLALQATSTNALTLVSAPQLIPGMTLDASNFTAGDTWRITATCFFSGIGDAAHAVAVRILQGTTVEHFGYETRIDGDSASKFELTVDRIITIANPPAAIQIHAEEDSGNVLSQGSTLIAMHVRTS